MDESLKDLIVNVAPNLFLAAWVILRDSKTIDKLLSNQQKLIDTLMMLHPPQDANKPPVTAPREQI